MAIFYNRSHPSTLKTYFVIVTTLCTTIIYPHSPRVSSEPYISGDSFRSLADHLFDETSTAFDPKQVQEGDIIFVKTDYLDSFFSTKHPHINNKYILITHNADHSAPAEYKHYLEEDKIIVWFGQNPTIQHHPKFVPIPIGIANQYLSHGNITTFNTVVDKTILQKIHLLGINFRPHTYPIVRKSLYNYFNNQSFCINIETEHRNHEQYLIHMAHTKFVLCPRGNGLDCHRTWEAFLVGAIPILEHSELDELLQDLPVVLVDNWKIITSDYLETKYKEIQSRPYNYDKIYFNYWRKLICSYKTKINQN